MILFWGQFFFIELREVELSLSRTRRASTPSMARTMEPTCLLSKLQSEAGKFVMLPVFQEDGGSFQLTPMSDVLKDNPVAAAHLKNISLHGDEAELQDPIECKNFVNMLVFQKDHKSNEQNGIVGNGFHFRRAFLGRRGGEKPSHALRLDEKNEVLLITTVTDLNRYKFIVREPRPREDLYIDLIIAFPCSLLVDNNNNALLRSEPAFEMLRKNAPVSLCTNELMWNGTSLHDSADGLVQYRYDFSGDVGGTAETAPVQYLKEGANDNEKINHLKCFLGRWSRNHQNDFVFLRHMKVGDERIYYSLELKDFLINDTGVSRSYTVDFELVFQAAISAYNEGDIIVGDKLNDFFTKQKKLSEISGLSCRLNENSPIWDKLATAEENDLKKFYCEKDKNGELVNRVSVPFICHRYRMTKDLMSYERKGFPNLLTDSSVLKICSYEDMVKAAKFCLTLNLKCPLNKLIGYIRKKVGGSVNFTFLCRCENFKKIIGISVTKPVHLEIFFANRGWEDMMDFYEDKKVKFSSDGATLHLSMTDDDEIQKCGNRTIRMTYYDMENSTEVVKYFDDHY